MALSQSSLFFFMVNVRIPRTVPMFECAKVRSGSLGKLLKTIHFKRERTWLYFVPWQIIWSMNTSRYQAWSLPIWLSHIVGVGWRWRWPGPPCPPPPTSAGQYTLCCPGRAIWLKIDRPSFCKTCPWARHLQNFPSTISSMPYSWHCLCSMCTSRSAPPLPTSHSNTLSNRSKPLAFSKSIPQSRCLKSEQGTHGVRESDQGVQPVSEPCLFVNDRILSKNT